MTDTIFLAAMLAVLAVGFVSVLLIRRGMKGITDALIKRLFNHALALVVALVAVLLVLVVLLSASKPVIDNNSTGWSLVLILVVSMLALISGTAIDIKKIGDVYGFRVGKDEPGFKAKTKAKKTL